MKIMDQVVAKLDSTSSVRLVPMLSIVIARPIVTKSFWNQRKSCGRAIAASAAIMSHSGNKFAAAFEIFWICCSS